MPDNHDSVEYIIRMNIDNSSLSLVKTEEGRFDGKAFRLCKDRDVTFRVDGIAGDFNGKVVISSPDKFLSTATGNVEVAVASGAAGTARVTRTQQSSTASYQLVLQLVNNSGAPAAPATQAEVIIDDDDHWAWQHPPAAASGGFFGWLKKLFR